MTDPRRTVLFMDDEIATADIVRYAVEALQEQGFTVHTTDRMSVAMDAFYQQYYQVFILDIEMGVFLDPQAQDGGDVARFLRSLDGDTHVIFFSARGHVHHWFAAANAHVFGYVHKNDDHAIEQLVALAEQAADAEEKAFRWPRLIAPPQRAMLVTLEPCTAVSPEQILSITQATLPDWDISIFSTLDEALLAKETHHESTDLSESSQAWGLIAVFSDQFSSRPTVLNKLSRLCQTHQQPQVIFGCCGEVGAMPSLHALVNLHPFRMIDLNTPDIPKLLTKALEEATQHYGRHELLRSSPQALHRLRLAFSPDTYAQMTSSPEPDESIESDTISSDEQEEILP